MPNRPSPSLHGHDRRIDVGRSAMVLVVFGVTLGGLHTILDGGGWWVLCTALTATVLASGVVVRAFLPPLSVRARIVAPSVGLVAALLLVILRFGGGTGTWGVIPNAEMIVRFGKLVRDAGYSITWQTVPANADEPISFVIALGVVALAVVAEIAAFSLRLPALVGLPLAVIFLVPGVTAEGRTDGWFFAASAMSYLALLLIGRRWHAVPALAVGVAAVIGGLVLPGVLPSTEITSISSGLGPTVSTGVNPILHLGTDLRDNDKRTVLTYSTVSGQPDYLRLIEIRDFSGESWGPGRPQLDAENRPVAFPRPPGLSVGISTKREVTYVHVANFVSPWLPLPYAPSSVTGLNGPWQFLRDSFTVASNSALARGENYTVSSQQITPTPEQLLAANNRVPAELQSYVSLPADTPESIARTAVSVTSADTSSYQKALALQEYLRSAPFSYSESAPEAGGYDGTGVGFVAAFLEQHRGYCIHFASAMAVMAREIGIPSRIIVGFQPGTLQSAEDNGRRLFAVTNKDLHAWPELYFGGVGWVRFEPTPSRGSVPEYANPTVAGVPPVVAPGTGGGSTSGRNSDGAPKIDDGSVSTPWLSSSSSSGWLVLGGVLGGCILVLLVPAAFRLRRRMRRLAAVAAGREPVVSLWNEIMESAADVSILVAASLTPREAVARLRRVRGMSGGAGEALQRVGDALEREGYGPPREVGSDDAAMRRSLVADTKMVVAALVGSAPSDEQLRAFLLPPSLVTRTKSAVGRWV